MDNRTEVREFLSSRRAGLKPDQAGLPAYGGNRRVPGLRMLIYTAEPATPTADALNLLASWAATQDAGRHPRASQATDEA